MILTIGVDSSKIDNKTGIIRCHNIRRWTLTELFLCQTSRASFILWYSEVQIRKEAEISLCQTGLVICWYLRKTVHILLYEDQKMALENNCFRSILGFTFCREGQWACSELINKGGPAMAMAANDGAKGDFWGKLVCCHTDCRSLSALLSILLNVLKEEYKIQS